MATEIDKQVQELFAIVQEKKAEISKAERPNWLTNCSFRYNKNSSESTNLQVCVDINELVSILAFVKEKSNSFNEAAKELGVKNEFNWFGFTYDEWKSDIKTRIIKIQITTKKKELELLEARLDKLISPELKAKLEIDEIKKLLSQ